MHADDRTLRFGICDDHIRIAWYPYTPATVFPHGQLPYESIREISITSIPVEIRTNRGEVLLVPAVDKDAMLAAARERSIPCVRRVDVWGLILEPFVDTEFTEEHDARTRTALAESGIEDATCTRLRSRLARIVGDYNFKFIWNWWGLSLFHAFDAIQFCGSIGVSQAMSDDEYTRFYWEAMELSERGTVISPL